METNFHIPKFIQVFLMQNFHLDLLIYLILTVDKEIHLQNTSL